MGFEGHAGVLRDEDDGALGGITQDACCDAVVAEGFEAGGHNGRDETTTMVLIPAVCAAVNIPVLAAGGIATGRQMLAAMVLGAEGVQVGSRFIASNEASSHDNFKTKVIMAKEGDTQLSLKQLTPVRLLKNNFFKQIQDAEKKCASVNELQQLLGNGRAKLGMFEGNVEEKTWSKKFKQCPIFQLLAI